MSKNNMRDKEFPIVLDKERSLRLDLNAFCVLEETYGDSFPILESAERGSLKALRSVVWAGLVHEDSTLTETDVGKMIHPGNLSMVTTLLREVIEAYLPEPKNSQVPVQPL